MPHDQRFNGPHIIYTASIHIIDDDFLSCRPVLIDEDEDGGFCIMGAREWDRERHCSTNSHRFPEIAKVRTKYEVSPIFSGKTSYLVQQ